MQERTETGGGFELFPVAKNLIFTIDKPVEKRKTEKGKAYYIFRTSTIWEGRPKKYVQALMAFMAGDLLRAIGATEEKKNVFVWDRDLAVGAQFMADVIHEKDYKDPSKLRSKWTNFRALAQELPDEALGVEPEEPAGPTAESSDIAWGEP